MMRWQVGSQTLPGCLEKRFVLSFPGYHQRCPIATKDTPQPSPVTGTCKV